MSNLYLANLFVGDYVCASTKESQTNFDAFLCCATDCSISTNHPSLCIDLLDNMEDDILPHLNKTNSFLQTTVIEQNLRVLVYCMHGRSRSVAVLTGFFMKIWDLSFNDAYGLILERYPSAEISKNFQTQLKEWHKNYKRNMDLQTSAHRMYWDNKTREKQHHDEEPPAKDEEEYEIIDTSEGMKYTCSKCRHILFWESNVIEEHREICGEKCSVVAIERLSWMNLPSSSADGKLNCPKCNNKVGHWSWPGIKCPGNLWLAPAFLIQRSKIDFS
jgi:dual specificity phosphatase 12